LGLALNDNVCTEICSHKGLDIEQIALPMYSNVCNSYKRSKFQI
jgi:hypothetical protein